MGCGSLPRCTSSASLSDQRQILICMDLPSLQHHTFLEFWIGQGHKAVNVDLCARPRCISLGIWNGQGSLLSSVEQSYLFDIFRPGQGSNVMDNSGWSFRSLQSGHFIDVKNNEKWQFNYWNYTLNWAIYRCKNDEYTPKNSDFNRKNDETIL